MPTPFDGPKARVLAGWDGERMVGTIQSNLIRDGGVDGYLDYYGLTDPNPGGPWAAASISSRLVIHPDFRGLPLAVRLAARASRGVSSIEFEPTSVTAPRYMSPFLPVSAASCSSSISTTQNSDSQLFSAWISTTATALSKRDHRSAAPSQHGWMDRSQHDSASTPVIRPKGRPQVSTHADWSLRLWSLVRCHRIGRGRRCRADSNRGQVREHAGPRRAGHA